MADTGKQENESVVKMGTPTSLKEFLEATPPGSIVSVPYIVGDCEGYSSARRYYIKTPDIQLHCNNDACNGLRFFHCDLRNGPGLARDEAVQYLLTYRCRNCQNTLKIFAVQVRLAATGEEGEVVKIGELPPFGPPTPARVIKLIGPDRDSYLMGRRAENQGMGIGSFAYYRRVVENQKNHILDHIINVAEKINASKDTIDTIKSAKQETQFKKAIELVRDVIPEVLLINGHNPLTLLHSALSQGLHAETTDQQCLELATSIRVVLTELAERLDQALKDKAELDAAVTRLMDPKAKQKNRD